MSDINNLNKKCNLLQLITHHTNDVTSCDFGAKFYLASVSSDKTIAVWEWTPGLGYIQTSYSPLKGHKYAITKVKFAPDGNSFVTTSYDGNIIHWNLKDGSVINTFHQYNNSGVRSVCFCAKSYKLISGGDDGSICIWNLRTNLCESILNSHEDTVSTIAVSPDEELFLSSDLVSQTKIWSLTSFVDVNPRLLYSIAEFHELGVNDICFSNKIQNHESSNVYLLVSCGNDDNLIKLWKLTYAVKTLHVDVSLYATLTSHTSSVTSVRFNNTSNIIASTCMDKTTKIWDVKSLSCIRTMESHTRYVTCCAFSCDDSLLATGSNDKNISVFDMRGNLNINVPLLFCCSNHAPSLFNKATGNNILTIVQSFQNLGNSINSVDISIGGIVCCGGSDKSIHLWCQDGLGVWSPHPSSPLLHHQYPVHQVEFCKTGSMLTSCSLDGTALVYDIKDSEIELKGSLHVGSNVRSCRFSPDTRLLATGGDDETVTIWRSDNLSLVMSIKSHTDAITCLGFSMDSKYLISGCARGNYRVWSLFPCNSICLYLEEDVHDLGLNYCEFIPSLSDSATTYTFATCGNDSLIKIWFMEVVSDVKVQCDLVRTLKGHGGDVTSIKYINPNIIVSSSTDKTLRFWNQENGETIYVCDTKDMPLTSCAFSSQRSLLVAGSLDKSVSIWKLDTKLLRTISSDEIQTTMFETDLWNGLQLDEVDFNLEIPIEYLCPITRQIMRDPVMCSDGCTYDRTAIELWLSSGKQTSPMTNKPFISAELTTNIELKDQIDNFIASKNETNDSLIEL